MLEEWTFNQFIVGEMLRHARKLRGYTLRGLQEMTGASASHILRVESGEYDVLLRTFTRVAICLEVPPGLLLEQGVRINPSFYANAIGESGELRRYIPAMTRIRARRGHATAFFTACCVALAYLLRSSNPRLLLSVIEFPNLALRSAFDDVAQKIDTMIIADRASLRIDLHSDPLGLLVSLEIIPKEFDDAFAGLVKYYSSSFTGEPFYLGLVKAK